jgi:hypothetical protein
MISELRLVLFVICSDMYLQAMSLDSATYVVEYGG